MYTIFEEGPVASRRQPSGRFDRWWKESNPHPSRPNATTTSADLVSCLVRFVNPLIAPYIQLERQTWIQRLQTFFQTPVPLIVLIRLLISYQNTPMLTTKYSRHASSNYTRFNRRPLSFWYTECKFPHVSHFR